MPSKPAIDLSEIDAFAAHGGGVCAVRRVLNALPEDKAAMLVAALDQPRFSGTQVSRWLKSLGEQASDGSIQRHRRGECSCGRT